MQMARPKLILSRISNERERNLAFNRRKNELLKMISEFSEMCGGEACLIIYDGDNIGNAPPVTWPQDPNVVQQYLIEKYEQAKEKNQTRVKIFDLEEFFETKKHLVESKISNVRKDTFNTNCPIWHQSLNGLGQEQLKNLIVVLDTKIEACDQSIKMLKEDKLKAAQANFLMMQYLSQNQAIHGYNQLAIASSLFENGEGSSQSQMLQFDPNLMKMAMNNNGLEEDMTNQFDFPMDCANQTFGISPNQVLDVPMLISENNWVVVGTNHEALGVPLNCASQINTFGDSTNHLDVPALMEEDNGNIVDVSYDQHDVLVDCTNQIVHYENSTDDQSDMPVLMENNQGMMNITTQADFVSVDGTNSTNQLDETIDWSTLIDEAVDGAGLSDEDWANFFDDDEYITDEFCLPEIGTNHISSSTTSMNGASSSSYCTDFHVLENPGSSSLCNYDGDAQPRQCFNLVPALQNIASQTENFQQGADLHSLPPYICRDGTRYLENGAGTSRKRKIMFR